MSEENKDLDNTTILELLNDAARKHGMEEIDSVESMRQEWVTGMLHKLVEGLDEEEKGEVFPSQQPSFEVMRGFHNLRIDVAVKPEYINWAVEYLGQSVTIPPVDKDWVPVVGDVLAVREAILKFAEEQKDGDE